MSWILAEILREIQGISLRQASFAEPDAMPNDFDHVIGTVNDSEERHCDLRKTLFLFTQYRQYIVELIPTLDLYEGEQYEAQVEHIKILDRKYALLENVLWISVRTLFPELRGKRCAAIRKGWKVAWSEKEDAPYMSTSIIFGVHVDDPEQPPSNVQWN